MRLPEQVCDAHIGKTGAKLQINNVPRRHRFPAINSITIEVIEYRSRVRKQKQWIALPASGGRQGVQSRIDLRFVSLD